MADDYDPKSIEAKWQERWLKENLFAPMETTARRKMYVLDMFPYPSGDGLHVGHAKIYTASDVVSRYLRMKGFDVLHPTGWDAFGLPTENSAIKFGIHPAELTRRNVARFRTQMQRLGLSYDWSREINTTDPAYYKWTQWIFLQLFKMGLVYEDTVPINWCPSCQTGLANEEVVDGTCERCGAEVELKAMRQWMMRITKYADRLLEGLGGLDWPKFIKELQLNWIGRRQGIEVVFPIAGSSQTLNVFTTRLDTIFGATYVVISPDHPLVADLTTAEHRPEVEKYQHQARLHQRRSEQANQTKTGVLTGRYAINPVTGQKLPIWVADYVLMSYGTGAVMAVPAHDVRDHAFAKVYRLPIVPVISPASGQSALPYVGEGTLINSGQFTGQKSEAARESIFGYLKLKGQASKTTHYKLRDWVFSRQRYWGEPIPLIHCEKCGVVPVPEKDLPVELPDVEHYEPTGTGESPLATVADWVNVKCPTCPRLGKRETNTMPQWAGSSWYWLRYLDPGNEKVLASPQAIKRWMPVDIYVGGAEHAVLHLLYARFWSMALYDAGIVDQPEPFARFRSVGLVLGEDGQKMSKSRGNVINPDQVVETYGADAVRMYEMFMGPFEASAPWDTGGLKGVHRFLKRLWSFFGRVGRSDEPDSAAVRLKLHQTIKRVSESIEQFKFNTGVSALMELLNELETVKSLNRSTLETLVLLLAPYGPHLAEELWERLGHGQSLIGQSWPAFDEQLLAKAAVQLPVQVNGKVRGVLTIQPGAEQAEVEQQARQLSNVARYLAVGPVTNIIYVPDTLLNFVVGGKTTTRVARE